MTLREQIGLRIMGAAAATKEVAQNLPKLLGKQMSRPPSDEWMEGMYGETYNEDRNLEDYQEMVETDSQIKAGLDLITYTLLSKKPIITPSGDTDKEKEVATFVEDMIGNMETPMRRVRKDMYTALPYGYSVSEIVYRYDEQENMVVWDRIVSIDIDTLEDCFVYDKEGRVKEVVQTSAALADDIHIPAEKCLIYSFDEEFGKKYGRSILKQCYDHWFMKRKILRWYAIFLQKIQNPVLYGKVLNPSDEDSMQEGLDNIREGRTNLVINQGDEIGLLESHLGGDGFLSAISYHDTAMFRRMMIGSLILGQAEASGSYAQSKTHKDVLSTVLEGIHEDVASIFQKKIKETVDYNFDVDKYPTFSFEPIEEADILALMAALQPLIQLGVIGSEPWVRDLISKAVELYSDVEVPEQPPVQAVPGMMPGMMPTGQTAPGTEPTTAKTPIKAPEEVNVAAKTSQATAAAILKYLREA